MVNVEGEKKKSRGEIFVEYVIQRIKRDSAFRASLSRADNPATEYQSWEHLTQFCDLENLNERVAFSVIAASLAKEKIKSDGHASLGRAVAICYQDGGGNKSDSAKLKMRRLLACDSTEEVCRILRSLLKLIASRGINLAYGHLLNDLTYFNEQKRIHWATDFYGRESDDSINA